MAGAKVIAIAKDSIHGSADKAIEHVTDFAKKLSLNEIIEFKNSIDSDSIKRADIVTNLGFVRPINEKFLTQMHPGAVVSLFCEPWETRSADIDLDYCKKNNIPVMGTNEDAPGLNVFDNVGMLVIKMLIESGLEVYQNNFLLIGSDKFADVIEKALTVNGNTVIHVNPAQINSKNNILGNFFDAIIVADYSTQKPLISESGFITPEYIHKNFPASRVVHLAGAVDAKALSNAGIKCYPGYNGHARRMSKTFAHLGIKPVIDLHAAGLKVGEILFKAYKKHKQQKPAILEALKNPICAKVC
jgi:hypothetical protein